MIQPACRRAKATGKASPDAGAIATLEVCGVSGDLAVRWVAGLMKAGQGRTGSYLCALGVRTAHDQGNFPAPGCGSTFRRLARACAVRGYAVA